MNYGTCISDGPCGGDSSLSTSLEKRHEEKWYKPVCLSSEIVNNLCSLVWQTVAQRTQAYPTTLHKGQARLGELERSKYLVRKTGGR